MVVMTVDLIQTNVWNASTTSTLKLNLDVVKLFFKNAMTVPMIRITAAIVNKAIIQHTMDIVALRT